MKNREKFSLLRVVVVVILFLLMRVAESNNGIPVGLIYDADLSQETKRFITLAIKHVNNEMKSVRMRWAFQTQEIKISDSYELINQLCQQMSRGVLSMFGQVSKDSFDSLKSFTDTNNLPFITWSSPIESSDTSETFQEEDASSMMEDESIGRELYSDHYISEDEAANSEVAKDEPSMIKKRIMKESSNYQLFLQPDLGLTLISLIKHKRWETAYYIYNYDLALSRINAILNYQTQESDFVTNIVIRKVSNISNCMNMLRHIDSTESGSKSNNIIMLVDLDSIENYESFLKQVKYLGMTQIRHHYVLVSLSINELDLDEFRHGGVNITGFSVVDYENPNTIKLLKEIDESIIETKNKPIQLPSEAAFIIDAMLFFSKIIGTIIGDSTSRLFGLDNVSLRRAEIYIDNYKGYNCSYKNKTEPWSLGKLILLNLTKGDTFEGLTGPLYFDEKGQRRNYTINIYRVSLNSPLKKIGTYSGDKGLRLETQKLSTDDSQASSISSKKRIIVGIIDPPFFMYRNDDGKNYTGNDRFIGYCVDLAKRISEIVNFTYEFQIVKDNKFGAKDASGYWNGIVGELIRNEADMAIAPLTISSQRERVIEFSKPFMNIGISIMIKKPKNEKPGVFSFMAPLSTTVWICVILAYIGVTLILFLVTRFSPYEWHRKKDSSEKTLENDFNMCNTLWFCLAAFMQQGVEYTPKSASGRLVASLWWFFTLILISSYTANLAAFLTIENMVPPIEKVEDLAKQTEIKYGTVDSGATKEFFKSSKVPIYSQMWAFMNSMGPTVFVKNNKEGVQKVKNSDGKYAFLLESSINEYLNERSPCDTMKVGNNLDSKGYGIATPIGSDLKESINLAVLELREEGYLDELKKKWWVDGSECGSQSKDSSQSSLNLINVAGIFYILVAGLLLSVILTACEILYKARAEAKKTKVEFGSAIKSKMRLSISGYDEKTIEAFKQFSSPQRNGLQKRTTPVCIVTEDSLPSYSNFKTVQEQNLDNFENQTEV